MAEVFGVAAGIVGLVSLTVQLTDSVGKFREIRHTYQDAPDEIHAYLETLDKLAPIIEQSCAVPQRASADAAQVQLLEDCKRRCQNVRKSIDDVLRSILEEIKLRPWIGKLKAVFEKKTIEEWLGKLERSKSELSLALTIFGR
jgi:hypothetical protein